MKKTTIISKFQIYYNIQKIQRKSEKYKNNKLRNKNSVQKYKETWFQSSLQIPVFYGEENYHAEN